MKIILIGYVVWVVAMFIITIWDYGNYAITPNQIKKISNLNTFGSSIIWIFMVLSNPLFMLAHVIVWMFTKKGE